MGAAARNPRPMRDVSDWKPRCAPPRRLYKPVRIDPTGVAGPTRGQARSTRWRASSRGFRVPAAADLRVPEQRILEMSVLLPDGGAVTGWAGARWRGAGYFDGFATDGRTLRPVPLAVGPGHDLRDRSGMTVLRDRLDAGDLSTVRGVSCATAERALFDDMRKQRCAREATVAMDMMAAAELTSISRMRAYCATRRGWNGLPLVLEALELADEASMSPNETRMRLVWVLDAGLPRPLVNQPVWDLRGNLLGIADLFDPVSGVVGEYDGAAHRDAGRHRRDVVREDRFRRAGLEYFKVVGPDLRDDGAVVDRMLSTRARARFLTPARRDWTLDPPTDWDESPLDGATLDERLAFRELLTEQADLTPPRAPHGSRA